MRLSLRLDVVSVVGAVLAASLLGGCGGPSRTPSGASSAAPSSAPVGIGVPASARNGALRISIEITNGPKAGEFEAHATISNSSTHTLSFDAPYASQYHFQAVSVPDGVVAFDSQEIDEQTLEQMAADARDPAMKSGRELVGGSSGGTTYRFTLPKGTYDIRMRTYPPEIVTPAVRVAVP